MIADNVDLNEVLANVATNTIDFAVNVGSVKTTQLSIADGAILPTTTNDIDLGGVGAEFKDVHSEGTAFLTLIESSGLANLNGGIEVDNGAVVFTVDSATGNVAVNGTLNIQASIAVDSVLDDGTMAANSATALVTQASVVTYVSTEITNATLDGGSF